MPNSEEPKKILQTQVIRRKVKNYFWYNLIPLSIVIFVGYLFYVGELTLQDLPEGREKLLWISILSAILMFTLIFLTYPFSVWLRRNSKRMLEKAFPAITGEKGFFSFIFGIPTMLIRLLGLFFTWCFYLIVIAMIVISGVSCLGMLSYAVYQTIGTK